MKDERKRILQMVEDGKLTVNEALVLLDQLEKSQQANQGKQQEELHELSAVIDNQEDANKKSTNEDYKTQSTTDKIFEFVDAALKKVKELDLDFNFGKYETVNHIFQQTNPNVEELDIDIANGSLTIMPWEQNDVRVECEAKVYRANSVAEAREQFLQQVDFAIEEGELRFILQQKLMKVHATCYIPKKEYESVRLRLFNGPITAKQLAVDEMKVKTANGKLHLSAITGKSVELETANGHISVEDSLIDDVEAETINGKVMLNGNFEQVDVQTFNGNIQCHLNGDRCKFMQTKAVTGGVEFVFSEQLKIEGELKTNLGGFKVELAEMEVVEEKSELTQKLFRFYTKSNKERQLHLLADTKTGSITLKKG